MNFPGLREIVFYSGHKIRSNYRFLLGILLHLPPLDGGGHPARHPLLDGVWLETGGASSTISSSSSTLWATTTRPPPQGSAAPPATRQAAAHRREVGGLRAVKQLRRRGVHCRWRGLEHGLGQVERWTWRWNNFSRGLARPPAPTGRGQRPAEAETQVQAFKTCAIVQKFSEFILISCQARF